MARAGAQPATLAGQVVAAYGRQFEVEIDGGGVLPCVVKGKKTGVACGDRVRVAQPAPDQGVIVETLPRRSLLYRSDQYKEKILAANVSQIVIVLAAVPSFYEDLLNRCLVAAEAENIAALIVLNKADLVEPTRPVAAALQCYRELGYPLVQLSAHQDVGPLRPHLAGHTSILVGQSGMGKSSLINALLPGHAVRTAEISAALDSGRHTTTHTRLYHLDAGSQIIDSPGLQEFGLAHVATAMLAEAFPEFRPLLGGCRFNNCLHLDEPGCAVAQAVRAGKIEARRYAAYRGMVAPRAK